MCIYKNEADAIMAAASQLADMFAESQIYSDYKNNRLALESDPLLLERVDVYKKMQFSLETRRLQGEEINFDEEKHVAYHYSQLMLDHVASAFLESEFELLDLYKRALDVVCGTCDALR